MQGDRIIIDKKYVHKIKEENVFLCNLRRELPFTINKDFFETCIPKVISSEEYAYLKSFYLPYKPRYGVPGGNPPPESYALRYLPIIQFLSPEEYDGLLAEKKAAWEKELLASLYTRESEGKNDYFRLKEDVTEPNDNYLVFSRKGWDLYVNIEERKTLSSILEKIPDVPKKETYFANMFVNPAHLFFFEHPNDHVPGMMLIETIRQFIVASGHIYGKIPMNSTQLILNSLDCQFLSYVNINYPILLKGTAVDYKFTREGHWQYVTLRTEVVQNGRCMALFSLKGTCISSGLFERIRRNQIAEMKRSRFIPVVKEKCILELSSGGSETRIPATLVNLSMEGMSIKMRTVDFILDQEYYEVSFFSDHNQPIKGRYKKIWHSQINGCVVVGLRNTELQEGDLARLYSLITHDCIAVEDRQLS